MPSVGNSPRPGACRPQQPGGRDLPLGEADRGAQVRQRPRGAASANQIAVSTLEATVPLCVRVCTCVGVCEREREREEEREGGDLLRFPFIFKRLRSRHIKSSADRPDGFEVRTGRSGPGLTSAGVGRPVCPAGPCARAHAAPGWGRGDSWPHWTPVLTDISWEGRW